MLDCEKLLQDLSPFHDSIILVGGWVPYVYMRDLWKQDIPNVRMTKDIDVAIRSGMKYQVRIQDVLAKKGYPMKHAELGLLKPYQFILRLEKQDIKIDFLGDIAEEGLLRKCVLGDEVIFNTFNGFNFVLTDPVEIKTGWGKFYVPRPERYLAFKGNVFLEEPVKRQRDIAMVYFCFSRCRKKDDLESSLKNIGSEPLVRSVVKGLKTVFKHSGSPVVLNIRNSLSTFGFYDADEEIYEEMKRFIRCCEGSL